MKRDQIFALEHIQDVALIKESDWSEDSEPIKAPARIEAYDISNIFGEYAVGSMVVFTDVKIDKNEYRRFRIKHTPNPSQEGNKLKGISDTAMLMEVLERRLNHYEWKMPELIIIDGGAGQFNAANKVLKIRHLDIPVISIAKGPTRKGETFFMTKNAAFVDKKIILAIRDESHRFAISYHRKLKRAGMWF